MSLYFDELLKYDGLNTVSDGLIRVNNHSYTVLDLEKIGENVASIWGGSCISFEVDKKGKEVSFNCIEHGEEFVSAIKFVDLAKYLT